MTAVFLTSASTSPWSRPGDWVDAGHQVELVGCGGLGGTGGTGANAQPTNAGAGGGYYKLTAPSGTLGSTTPFAVKTNNSAASNDTNATFWEGTTTTNTYEAQCGRPGAAGSTSSIGGSFATNGTPSPVIYTAAGNKGGDVGNWNASAFIGGSAGGGAGGPSGVGAGTTAPTPFTGGGGCGGSGANGGVTNASSTTASGTAGGNGQGGSGGGAGSTSTITPNGSAGTVGGGGGGGAGSAVTTTGQVASGNAGGTLGNVSNWVQTSDSSQAGAGGGGGGSGSISGSVTATAIGGAGANYGGGGGSGGACRGTSSTTTGGTGAGGLIVITYTGVPPTPPPGKFFTELAPATPTPAGALRRDLQSWAWFYNLNLISRDRFPPGIEPGNPIYALWPPPPQQPALSWTWSYSRNLIGQDKLPTGEAVTDLSPVGAIYHVQLRTWIGIAPPTVVQPFAQYDWPLPSPRPPAQTWTWQYNLNLIGRDAMLAGEQVYDLVPSQRPSEQVQLHSWSWQYNVNLIGQDRMIVGKQVSDRPTLAIPPAAPTWAWQYNPNLIGQDQLPFRQLDWPVPRAAQQPALSWTDPLKVWLTAPVLNITISQYWDRPQLPVPPAPTWTWQYNLNLVGQDRFPAGEQVYDRPILSIPPAQTWLDLPKYNLIAKPFLQTDWPNPTQPYRLEQTWVRWYSLNLIGQDQLPFRQLDWPLPQVARQPAQTWLDPFKIWLTAPVLNFTISQYFDRPQLPVSPAQTWTVSYLLSLIGQDRLPTGAQVSDRPTLSIPSAQTWLDLPKYSLIAKPFFQSDWPYPTQPYRIEQTWVRSYNLNLIGQDRMVTGEQVTDLPPRDFARLFQTWISSVNAALVVTPPVLDILKPQRDWPVPRGAEPDSRRSWEWQYNKNLIGQDQLPVRQQDWPNPTRAVEQARDWIAQTKILLAAPTFIIRQSDWPLPQVAPRAVQTWVNTVQLPLVAKPFAQTDWPILRAPQQAALSWIASYNLDLLGQDRLPVGRSVTDLAPRAPIDLRTWIQTVNLALTVAPPTRIISAIVTELPPQPTPRQVDLSSWLNAASLALTAPVTVFVTYIFNPPYYTNPRGPEYQNDLRTWLSNATLALTAQPIGGRAIELPVVATQPSSDLRTWIQTVNLALTARPFSQTDWPNPQASQVAGDLRTWIQSVNLELAGRKPFSQTDWPLSAAHNQPLLQTWYTGLNALLIPAPVIPPGVRFRGTIYDRPQLRQDVPPDEFFAWSRYPVIPPFIPTFGANYRLLADHYLYGVYYKPNTIITEGREIPFGWTPTLAVDPLDALAVAAFYKAGPRNAAYEDLSTYQNMYKREFADVPVNSPATFWQQVPGTKTFRLTGLGTGNPPIGA